MAVAVRESDSGYGGFIRGRSPDNCILVKRDLSWLDCERVLDRTVTVERHQEYEDRRKRVKGLEPSTYTLATCRSTTELHPQNPRRGPARGDR
jgi:hypothetical protein